MKGLIIKPYWADLILSGEKTWEIRGSQTHHRGEIGIIKSGTKQVYGTSELVDCIPCSLNIFNENYEKHRIDDKSMIFYYNQSWAWVLQNAKILPEPIPYPHKQGAIIWVNLPDNFEVQQ